MEENNIINGGADELNPNFNFMNLMKKDAGDLLPESKTMRHEEILSKLLSQIKKVDFRAELKIDDDENVKRNQQHVLVIDTIIECAKHEMWGLCRNDGFTYLYNGEYWKELTEETLKTFLGTAAEKMGIDHCTASHFQFKNELYKQFNDTIFSAAVPRKVLRVS